MNKNHFFFLPLLLFAIKTHAQLPDKKIAGTYYLEGVMEVGSGFQLSEDHTFEFFFSYGALDRTGKGTWKATGNQIIFNSEESWPGADFSLVKQDNRKQKGIVIQVTDKNTMMPGYVGCRISGDGKMQELQTEKDGKALFESQPIDTISLYHQFFSDQLSEFPIKETKDNYFEFTFKPHLGMVFFNNFILTLDEDELTGGHPLMKEDREYRYVKSE